MEPREFISACTLAQGGERQQTPHDQISQLPDDILAYLLSNLPLKEAGATSILSKQWEHTWKFTNWLDFDASKMLNEITCKFSYDPHDKDRLVKNTKLLKMGIFKYVNWLNKVLKSHKSSALREFRIRFDLDNVNRHIIDSWLQFAFARRVQSLEVNLLRRNGTLQNYDPCYAFPHHLLPKYSCCRFIQPNSNLDISHPRKTAVCGSLKVLIFKSVSVSNEVLQFFLSNCPYLESLVVHGSGNLENFEVSGRSLVLKHLEIRRCPKMTTLKVSNTNLVSMVFIGAEVLGKQVGVQAENLPSLIEAFIGYVISVDETLISLSSCLSQLQVLKLHMSQVADWERREYSLPKLKQLGVYEYVNYNNSLLKCASLIKAAPYLEEFVLQLQWFRGDRMGKLSKIPNCPHQCLKRIEFLGYYGHRTDFEFVRFFLKNVIDLEELVIDTRNQAYVHLPYPITAPRLIEEGKTTRDLARQQLEGQVPLHVRLLIT